MKKQPNYKAIFFLGITFIGAGVVFIASEDGRSGGVVMGIGALCMIIGIKNKDKWRKR